MPRPGLEVGWEFLCVSKRGDPYQPREQARTDKDKK